MASVTVDDVHDVINISSADVPDDKVLKMLRRAEVTLERARRLGFCVGVGVWSPDLGRPQDGPVYGCSPDWDGPNRSVVR